MANEAVVVEAGDRLLIRSFEMPRPRDDEAVVRVEAFSLNRGEVRRAWSGSEVSWRPGYDLAGTVLRAAATGIGPREGTRVVGLVPQGSWARYVAVPIDSLAALPPITSTTTAATLPTAGLTAYYALKQGGLLLGKRVLVTGASGGVGDFALQMARRAGAAVVVAQLRRASHEAAALAAGATAVAIGDSPAPARSLGPFDLIVDGVNGAVLAQALEMLAPGGVCATYGSAAGERLDFDLRRFFRSGRTSLRGIALFEELRHDDGPGPALARLVALAASGDIRPRIAIEDSWQQIDRIARALMARDFAGKAVLRIDGDPTA
ncbi:MAG: zinc-binding dehydrogenase [Alphaproteobacteria bacterium]|nr:zinc-binding dehydrogenase [Alphaproteobacteria bacterium]